MAKCTVSNVCLYTIEKAPIIFSTTPELRLLRKWSDSHSVILSTFTSDMKNQKKQLDSLQLSNVSVSVFYGVFMCQEKNLQILNRYSKVLRSRPPPPLFKASLGSDEGSFSFEV